jgi:hypothetical protein
MRRSHHRRACLCTAALLITPAGAFAQPPLPSPPSDAAPSEATLIDAAPTDAAPTDATLIDAAPTQAAPTNAAATDATLIDAAPIDQQASPLDPAPPPSPAAGRWLPWTLFGLGAAATASTLVAFRLREQHATRWNGAACIRPGLTRGSVCPDERDAIRTWDTVLALSGVSAGLLFGGAVLSRSLQGSPARSGAGRERAGVSECGVSWGQVSCSGRF